MSKKFIDFREVNSRITMEQVLEHYGVLDTFKRSGTRLSGPCPIHVGTNPSQFRVEIEKNTWNCFSECRQGGNVLDFIVKKEGVSILVAARKACEWFDIKLSDVDSSAIVVPNVVQLNDVSILDFKKIVRSLRSSPSQKEIFEGEGDNTGGWTLPLAPDATKSNEYGEGWLVLFPDCIEYSKTKRLISNVFGFSLENFDIIQVHTSF